MLTRSRIASLTGLTTLMALAGLATAPAAPAAPAAAAVPAAPTAPVSRIPSSAVTQVARELLRAWQITRGQGTTIAVLSTGVARVTSLAGKVTTGPDLAPLRGARPGGHPTDGTVLASLIAGSGPSASNPLGTIGRAPGARILSVQIADYGVKGGGRYEQNGTWQNTLAKGIRYAASHGARVIVIDARGSGDTGALDQAVQYALDKDVVVLGSDVPGDQGQGATVPDDLPGVINFSGTVSPGLFAPPKRTRSARDVSVVVTVPDDAMAATCPGNMTCWAWGYYSAEAWMAGTVALIKAVYPRISPALVARALALSASYHPAGGYNTTVGFGLLNPDAALQEAAKLVSLRFTAAPGPDVVSADARLSSGPPPGVIDAVRHSPVKIAGFAAAIVVGALLLLLASVLVRRGRRAAQADPPSAFPAGGSGG